jgi:predicted acylesterase/phospholipase RssA
MKKFLIIVLIAILLVFGWLYFVKGYLSVRLHKSVPERLVYDAKIPGRHGIRFMLDPLKLRSSNIQAEISKAGLTKAKFSGPEINVLIISGGGANGAYSAGVLCGWTDTEKRPQFDIVTGVSTGALIAPAAFVGPTYDHVLKDIYTNISDADIMKSDIVEFLFEGRPSLMDTQPLREVLKKTVTMDLLRDVARAHAAGRRLYVATTNLDARRLVTWDMGAIASAGTEEALELFRNVMIASASIPVAFPPVMFKVEAGGNFYEEMHVDGSVTMQMIGSLMIAEYDEVKAMKTNIYILKNSKFADVPEGVSLKIWDIAGASFETLLTWQSYGELYSFATLAHKYGAHIYLTCIPYEFREPRKGEFDLIYMRKLFYRGYRTALSEDLWMKGIDKIVPDADHPDSFLR